MILTSTILQQRSLEPASKVWSLFGPASSAGKTSLGGKASLHGSLDEYQCQDKLA